MKQLLSILFFLITLSAVAQVDQATSSVFTQGDLAQRVGTKDGVQMKVGGLATIGDGGGGTFRWDANSTASPIPGKIIQPVISGVPQPAGRWLLVLQAQEGINGLSDSLAAIRSSAGTSTTTIISSNGRKDTSMSVTAPGTTQDIKLYVGDSTKVTGVQNTSLNGGGIYTFKQVGDSLIIHYSQAPEGQITYNVTIFGATTAAAGGGSGGGGSGGGSGGGGSGGGGSGGGGSGGGGSNSPWVYTIDTSCRVKYGALFSLNSPSNNMIALANLGMNYARVSQNNSSSANYTAYTSGGYNTLLSLNPSAPVSGSYTALPTDSLAYRNGIKTFLGTNGTTNLAGVALINEPANIKHGAGYWNPGSAQNVINLLRAGGNALHELGLKAYDGGLFSGEIAYYEVWKDLVNRGHADSAAIFATSMFPAGTNLNNWATDTTHGYRIRYMDSLIAAFPTLPLDGANMHLGLTVLDSDSTDASIDTTPFLLMVRYIHRITGKPVISNEISFQNNSNQDILSQVVDVIETAHDAKNGDMSMVYFLNQPAHTLANSDGSLTTYGTALKTKLLDTHVN